MAEKTKTYTHEQVEKVLSQAKANIEQLKKDVADRDSKIKELDDKISSVESKKNCWKKRPLT